MLIGRKFLTELQRSYGSTTERRSLMKLSTTEKLRIAFDAEIALFLAFVEKVSKQSGGTGIREGVVDDPFWNPYLEWRGRLIGMERMLLAAGVRPATVNKAKSALPEKLRDFSAHHIA